MNKRSLLKHIAAGLAAATLAGASGTAWAQAAGQTLRIGFFPGPYADQFKRGVQPVLEKNGIKLQITEFSNAIQPNSALMDGALDANVFQNRSFMELFNSQNKGDLVEVLRVPSAPLGIYSKKYKDLASVPNGATIALSNDPTNMGRSLAFLQEKGLLKLDPAVQPGRATEKNVASNPRNFKLVPLDAPQIPRAMQEMDLSVALGNHIIASGMLLSDAIALEDPAPQYQIIVTTRAGAQNSPAVQQLVAAYKSADYRRFIESDPKSRGFSRPDYWR